MHPTRVSRFVASVLAALALLAVSHSDAVAATYGAAYQVSGVLVPPSISNKTVPVVLTNTGTATWDTSGLYYLTYHVYQGATLVTWGGAQTTLPASVVPSASLLLAAKISSPATEGTYTVSWDMVGPSGVFSGLGTPTADMTMTVSTSAPSIASITPSSAITGSLDVSLVVTGVNFTSGLVAEWNGSPLITTFTDATHLSATIPTAYLATPGSGLITVTNGSSHSTGTTFTITYPSPTISSITPNTTPSGGSDLTLTITGTNFYPGSSAYASNIGGNSGYLASTVISSTQLTAILPASWMLSTGSGTIIVRTPDRLKSSSSRAFTITQAPPILGSMDPSSSFAGQPSFTLTLAGNNFITGTTAYWDGASLPTTVVSVTELTASVPASKIAAAGTATVTAAASSGSSGALTFTILSADQTITFPPIPDSTMANSPLAISAAASSGLLVSLVATGECTLAGNTLTLTGEGICEVVASQTGNTNYNPAPSVTNTFAISKIDQAITFGSLTNSPANVPPLTLSATATSGLPVSLVAIGECSLSGNTLTLISDGACEVVASQAGNASYKTAVDITRSFLISKAGQTIIFNSIPDALLNQATLTIAPSSSSGLPVSLTSTGPCVVDAQIITFFDLGTCAVTASQDGDAIYEAAASVTRSFDITKLPQAITFAPILNKLSTELPFSIIATASSGLPIVLSSIGSCAVAGTEAEFVDSGICTITAEQPGDDEYESAISVSRTFSIDRLVQTITFDPLTDMLTTDTPFIVTPTASSGLDVTITADGPCSASGSTITPLRVGLCTVIASQLGNQVYALVELSRSFSITAPSTSQTPLVLTPLVQSSPTSVSATFTWPDSVTGTLHRVNCGTLREQTVAGRTGTCAYTRPGVYKLQGRFTPTDGSTNTTLAPSSITVPSITPVGVAARLALLSEGSLTETAGSQPNAPAYQLDPKEYPPVFMVTATPLPPVSAPPGILESLDAAQSLVVVNAINAITNLPSTDPPQAAGKLRYNNNSRLYATALQLRGKRQADSTMSIDSTQAVTITAKTTSGVVLTATSPLSIARATLVPTVKVTSSDGPYAPAFYRFRVTAMNSPIKRDRIGYLWTITKNDDLTPLRQLAGTLGISTTFDTPGEYHVALSIKGALSNEVLWNTTVLVPPDPDPSSAAIRVNVDGVNRPPAFYSFRAILPELLLNDRYTQIQWTVDGQAPSYKPNRHMFTTAGPHLVHVTATTAKNITYSADATVIIEPNIAPIGRIDCNPSLTATTNAILKCNAYISDPDGRIARWRWVVPELNLDTIQHAALRLPVAQPPQLVTVESHVTDNSGAEAVFITTVDLGVPRTP